MYAYGLVTFIAAFLGTYLAIWVNLGPKPRHNVETQQPQRFPIDLDQGIDLDEMDRPTRGAGEL